MLSDADVTKTEITIHPQMNLDSLPNLLHKEKDASRKTFHQQA